MQRMGDAMVVVNDSRGKHSGRAARRMSTSASHSIGILLSQDKGGFIRGDDDHGHAVLAYAQPVTGTSWILVGKLDESEAFAELNRIVLLVASIAAALLLLGAWWWVELERAEQDKRLAELSRRVVSVQEDERRRLATELHDRTGANLAAINLNLKYIAQAVPLRGADDEALLNETRDLLADTVVSIREFCSDLRPAILDYAGLAPAIEHSVAQFSRRTGIDFKVDHHGFSGRCRPDVESVLFRITQEALLNCAKHSHANTVRVTLVKNADHVTLTIADDGVGFAPGSLGQAGQDTGKGMLHMRERAAFAGGTLAVESAPGNGTRITVEVG